MAFWDRVGATLDRLALDRADRRQIEAAIAAKVARPTAAERRRSDREIARIGKSVAAAFAKARG